MKTYILTWNPDLPDSFQIGDFQDEIYNIEFGDFAWPIFDILEAHNGDNFYLIKCGKGTTGIVMKGFFTSEFRKIPINGDITNWEAFINMRPTFAILPEHPKGIISIETLEKKMPDFQWNGGPSGRELPHLYTTILNEMWEEFEANFTPEDFDNEQVCKNLRPCATIDDAIAIALDAHQDQKDLDGKPVILHPLTVGLSGSNEEEIICGILHDVLEDSDWTPGRIREKGFSEHIVDTLLLLCHDKSVPYMDYVEAIVHSGNKTAIAVKLNDLRHNLARGRAGGHTKQVAKHSAAIEYITSVISR